MATADTSHALASSGGQIALTSTCTTLLCNLGRFTAGSVPWAALLVAGGASGVLVAIAQTVKLVADPTSLAVTTKARLVPQQLLGTRFVVIALVLLAGIAIKRTCSCSLVTNTPSGVTAGVIHFSLASARADAHRCWPGILVVREANLDFVHPAGTPQPLGSRRPSPCTASRTECFARRPAAPRRS